VTIEAPGGRQGPVTGSRLVRGAGLVLALALLTGCASGTERAAGPASGSSSPSAVTPSPAAVDPNGFPLPQRPDCAADAGGEFVRATTSDGNGVGILLIGTGTGGVVLGPHDNGDICQWLPYAKVLAQRYRVALFDWKDPRPEVPLLAVAALRKAGARKVVLGGASYGGAMALSQAYRVRPRLAGVLSLGGEITLPGFDGRAGIRQWHGPLLQISSADDDFFDNADARELRALHPGAETILMLAGRAHGVELLDGPDQARVRAAIEAFLASNLG
jgi:hypothetical protein